MKTEKYSTSYLPLRKKPINIQKVEKIMWKIAILVEKLSKEVKELSFTDPRGFKVDITIDNWFDPD